MNNADDDERKGAESMGKFKKELESFILKMDNDEDDEKGAQSTGTGKKIQGGMKLEDKEQVSSLQGHVETLQKELKDTRLQVDLLVAQVERLDKILLRKDEQLDRIQKSRNRNSSPGKLQKTHNNNTTDDKDDDNNETTQNHEDIYDDHDDSNLTNITKKRKQLENSSPEKRQKTNHNNTTDDKDDNNEATQNHEDIYDYLDDSNFTDSTNWTSLTNTPSTSTGQQTFDNPSNWTERPSTTHSTTQTTDWQPTQKTGNNNTYDIMPLEKRIDTLEDKLNQVLLNQNKILDLVSTLTQPDKTAPVYDIIDKDNVRIGDGDYNALIPMSDYLSIYRSSKTCKDFVRKMTSHFFDNETLATYSYHGSSDGNSPLVSNSTFKAIMAHTERQYPGVTTSQLQLKEIRETINGKCRKARHFMKNLEMQS